MMDMIWTGLYFYGVAGGIVALAFVFYGFDRIDTAAHGAYLMRPLLLPGLSLLWPIVVIRWITLERRKGPVQ